MRTYELFVEITRADFKAMGGNDKQEKELKRRRKVRGGGEGIGSDGSTGSHFHNNKNNSSKPSNSSALAVRPPGGRGVGTTQTSYKTGPLARRAADKGSALVKGKNFKAANNDEKKTGNRPGSTRDGWGVKPTGDFRDPGNAAHDKAKKMSAYDKARKKRDIENKLDKEDKKKGRFGRFAKNALGAAGKVAGVAANQARSTQQDKGEKMQDAQVTSAKRGIYNP